MSTGNASRLWGTRALLGKEHPLSGPLHPLQLRCPHLGSRLSLLAAVWTLDCKEARREGGQLASVGER